MYARARFFEWLFLVGFWMAITSLFTAVGVVNVELFVRVIDPAGQLDVGPIGRYLFSGQQYLEGLLFGFLFGTLFFLINRFTNRPAFQKRAFGQIVLIKSALYTGSIFLMFSLSFMVFTALDMLPKDLEQSLNMRSILPSVWVTTAVYFAFFIMLTNFVIQLNKKFGPGQLLSLFFGKYHHPVIEERIFLFTDLRSSTTYAERLGHLRYSKLIQDCFRDLNAVAPKYRAEIYQYVGDEAVLTWPVEEALNEANCIRVYFAFTNRIRKRADYYERKYGFVPEFKAGANGGTVTVAEVGNIKREIAYHGDVINTASRIQEVCNKYQKRFLVSRRLVQKMTANTNHFPTVQDS